MADVPPAPESRALRTDPVFRDLAAQVHAQDILLDGIVFALFSTLSPGAAAGIVDQMRRNAASVGSKGRLSDANAVFKADVKVAAQSIVEERLRQIEAMWLDDLEEPPES